MSATDQLTQWRVNTYRLLARLFAQPIDQELLTMLVAIDLDQGDETLVMNDLVLAAKASNPEQIAEEYQALFIGITRGELLPYGSFYQTGFLMEKPLVLLRADLQEHGFQRQPEICEPEDHISALCEVMSILVQENRVAQHDFFQRHLNNWVGAFFADLESAQSAVFYRPVARLGLAFFKIEADNLI